MPGNYCRYKRRKKTCPHRYAKRCGRGNHGTSAQGLSDRRNPNSSRKFCHRRRKIITDKFFINTMNLTPFMNLILYTRYAENVLVKQLFFWILCGANSEVILSCQINQAILTKKI